MYFSCDHPEKFYPEVKEALTAFENRLIGEQESVVATAHLLFDEGNDDLAKTYLTDYSLQNARDALLLGKPLLASIEARTKVLFGYRKPQTDVISKLNAVRLDCLIE